MDLSNPLFLESVKLLRKNPSMDNTSVSKGEEEERKRRKKIIGMEGRTGKEEGRKVVRNQCGKEVIVRKVGLGSGTEGK